MPYICHKSPFTASTTTFHSHHQTFSAFPSPPLLHFFLIFRLLSHTGPTPISCLANDDEISLLSTFPHRIHITYPYKLSLPYSLCPPNLWRNPSDHDAFLVTHLTTLETRTRHPSSASYSTLFFLVTLFPNNSYSTITRRVAKLSRQSTVML